jgi:hypothetical protein
MEQRHGLSRCLSRMSRNSTAMPMTRAIGSSAAGAGTKNRPVTRLLKGFPAVPTSGHRICGIQRRWPLLSGMRHKCVQTRPARRSRLGAAQTRDLGKDTLKRIYGVPDGVHHSRTLLSPEFFLPVGNDRYRARRCPTSWALRANGLHLSF